MLAGTIIGVLVIPGLNYLFAKMSDGRKLIRDESETPLSESLDGPIHVESHDTEH